MLSLKHLLLGLFFCIPIGLVAPSKAQACSCIPPTAASSWNHADHVFTGIIVSEGVSEGERIFVAAVSRPIKGMCNYRRGDFVMLVTPANGATCGTNFEVGRRYVINAYNDRLPVPGVLHVNLCDYNVRLRRLTRSDRKFYVTRERCCPDGDGRSGELKCECVGAQRVLCFANPCEFAECAGLECQANFCGGCRAEFYDRFGNAACTPCGRDQDCSFSQVCAGGECVPE